MRWINPDASLYSQYGKACLCIERDFNAKGFFLNKMILQCAMLFQEFLGHLQSNVLKSVVNDSKSI